MLRNRAGHAAHFFARLKHKRQHTLGVRKNRIARLPKLAFRKPRAADKAACDRRRSAEYKPASHGVGKKGADHRSRFYTRAATARRARRLRSISFKSILRRRICVGVTSTSSSSSMYSRASSSDSRRGGFRRMLRSLAGGAHVGELLFLGRIDVHVVGAAVLADDHALVDLVAGRDEQLGPLLQAVQAEGHRPAGAPSTPARRWRGRGCRLPSAGSPRSGGG